MIHILLLNYSMLEEQLRMDYWRYQCTVLNVLDAYLKEHGSIKCYTYII